MWQIASNVVLQTLLSALSALVPIMLSMGFAQRLFALEIRSMLQTLFHVSVPMVVFIAIEIAHTANSITVQAATLLGVQYAIKGFLLIKEGAPHVYLIA